MPDGGYATWMIPDRRRACDPSDMLGRNYAYAVLVLVVLIVLAWSIVLFARGGYLPGEVSDLFVPADRYDPTP